MGTAGPEDGAEGGQRGVFSRDGAGRPAGVAGRAPGRRGAAAVSAVLQGANLPCPYETSAAGPIRAHGGAGGVHECLRQYAGPYAVLERGEKVFRLQVGDREEAVSVDRLKPHTGVEPVQPATPPKRGRPPHPPLPPSDGSAEGGPVETL
jgi:hypothetical protein